MKTNHIPDKEFLKHSLFEGVDVEFLRVDPSLCNRGAFQSRTHFDEQELANLAEALKSTGGNYNPVIVRPRLAGGYEILAGERRVRAAIMAKLQVLIMVGKFDDEQSAIITVTENLQRENLNPIEEAEGLAQMAGELGLTHREIGELIGRSRMYVSNKLLLLNLDISVKDYLRAGKLSDGHAKAIVGLAKPQQRELARKAVSHEWTVRRLEEEAKKLRTPDPTPPPYHKDRDIALLEEDLSETVGQPCRIQYNDKTGAGELKIRFFGNSDFEGILSRLRGV
ncbi:ParB family chromosome partitioning protein [Litorivivens lipolytica]|uniref:Probable chromosome-partitioning protein ParB n=1 Tax=Litorivivens lipolytica TaxID=1524264 RepID=A0A7W4Z8E8_9GAMM|nr:ParB family chromosome partitioning protein [Litorivivens lipolytica]